MKLTLGVLDLENFKSAILRLLDTMWQPCVSDARVANSMSWSYLGQFLEPRLHFLIYASCLHILDASLKLDCIWIHILCTVNSASGVHDFSLAFAPQIFCSCLRRILTFGLLFFADSGSLSQSSASLLSSWENISFSQLIRLASTWEVRTPVHGQAWFMGEYLDWPACSIGEHSGD